MVGYARRWYRASSAIFSVVNTVLLRPLPYRDAERIVVIQELSPQGKRVQVTPANFLDWRAQNTVFEQLAAILTRPANLALTDQAERVDLAMTSVNFFNVLGTQPVYGRFFINEEEQAGHAPVAVVSHTLWQRRYGSDPSLVGKQITLDGNSYTVVGIAPAGFQYPDKTEVWIPPFRLAPAMSEQMDPTQVRGFGMLATVGLLKPGITLPQAAAEMETIVSRLRQQYPDTNNRRFNRVVHCKASGWRNRFQAVAVIRSGGFCFADRVRQRRESSACRRCGPSERDGHSNCARRFANTSGPPATH